jgi:hypothetical protein
MRPASSVAAPIQAAGEDGILAQSAKIYVAIASRDGVFLSRTSGESTSGRETVTLDVVMGTIVSSIRTNAVRTTPVGRYGTRPGLTVDFLRIPCNQTVYSSMYIALTNS